MIWAICAITRAICIKKRNQYCNIISEKYPNLTKKSLSELGLNPSQIIGRNDRKSYRIFQNEFKNNNDAILKEKKLERLVEIQSQYWNAYKNYFTSKKISTSNRYANIFGKPTFPISWEEIDRILCIPESTWHESEEKITVESLFPLSINHPLMYQKYLWDIFLKNNLSTIVRTNQFKTIIEDAAQNITFEDKKNIVNATYYSNDWRYKEEKLAKVKLIQQKYSKALVSFMNNLDETQTAGAVFKDIDDSLNEKSLIIDPLLLPWETIESILSRNEKEWECEERNAESKLFQQSTWVLSHDRILRARVSNWPTILHDKLPHRYLVDYYPIRYTNVSNKADNDRKRIWRFKDGNMAEQNSFVFELKSLLSTWFLQSDFPSLTFVCVPASTKETNRIRYQNFSEMLCSKLKMINAYNHITITKDGTPKHTGGGSPASYYINSSFFKNKNVILFDDVLTSGSSMKKWKEKLEGYGAHIICAITLGKTV